MAPACRPKKVKDLIIGSRFDTLQLKVCTEPRRRTVRRPYEGYHQVISVEAEDDTGQVTVDLWDDEGEGVEPGTLLKITDGYVKVYQGRTRVLVGKYGTLEKLK